MKKLMVMALTVTLLLTGIGTTASAAVTCAHRNTTPGDDEWRATGHGYYHSYAPSLECKVDTMRKYTAESCNDCGALILRPTDTLWDSHAVTSHNLPRP